MALIDKIKKWSFTFTVILFLIDISLLYASWYTQENNITFLGFIATFLVVIFLHLAIYTIFKFAALYNKKYNSFNEYYDKYKKDHKPINILIDHLYQSKNNKDKDEARKVLKKILKYEGYKNRVDKERESISIIFDLSSDIFFFFIGLIVGFITFEVLNIYLIAILYLIFSLCIALSSHLFYNRIKRILRELEPPRN